MKSFFVKAIHNLFRIRIFENILKPVVRNARLGSLKSKFVPPNHTYRNPDNRKAVKGSLILYANLYDYNDWKAYWGLKEAEREKLYRLAEHCRTVVDVGVNNGWVLMNLATIVSARKGFVYGFEPHPDTFKRCIKNVEASHISNCKIFNLGCGENEGELLMASIDESNSGQSLIIEENKISSVNDIVRVGITTLDKQLGHLENIDLVKIDVEGFEMNVLKGAKNILEKYHPCLFVEIDDRLLHANHTSAKEIVLFLKDQYGYEVRNAFSGKLIDEPGMLANCHIDIICT